MSVGGSVTETIDCGDVVWINTVDQYQPCAIYVERTDQARAVSPGDHLWWQGAYAMWTPKGQPFVDKPLRRVGCSGISRAQALGRSALEPAGRDA